MKFLSPLSREIYGAKKEPTGGSLSFALMESRTCLSGPCHALLYEAKTALLHHTAPCSTIYNHTKPAVLNYTELC